MRSNVVAGDCAGCRAGARGRRRGVALPRRREARVVDQRRAVAGRRRRRRTTTRRRRRRRRGARSLRGGRRARRVAAHGGRGLRLLERGAVRLAAEHAAAARQRSSRGRCTPQCAQRTIGCGARRRRLGAARRARAGSRRCCRAAARAGRRRRPGRAGISCQAAAAGAAPLRARSASRHRPAAAARRRRRASASPCGRASRSARGRQQAGEDEPAEHREHGLVVPAPAASLNQQPSSERGRQHDEAGGDEAEGQALQRSSGTPARRGGRCGARRICRSAR